MTAGLIQMRSDAAPLLPRAIIVMGVSGSGKTSVAEALARRLSLEFLEGDQLHPPGNVEKMSKGIPLADEDRWPWLDLIGERKRTKGIDPGAPRVAFPAA